MDSFRSTKASVAQRKLQTEANDLQRATSELAKKQLEMLHREDAGKNKARLSLDLVREGRTNFRFHIRNLGDADATDVELELLVDSKNNPIVQDQYDEKFPIKRLQPGSSVSLIAALHLGSPMGLQREDAVDESRRVKGRRGDVHRSLSLRGR